MSRLESESLRADLASVESLLRERAPEQDPVGHFQYTQRKAGLESKIAELQQAASNTSASHPLTSDSTPAFSDPTRWTSIVG